MKEIKERKYWYIFSISDIVFILILIGILSNGARLISDIIIGVHIRVGDYIINNLAIPTHDIFSHAAHPITWTPPQWLAEVIFGALNKIVGLTGLTVFVAFFIAAIYAILFKFMRSLGISIIVAFFITLLAAGASAVHWLARPHIFSVMFTLLWYIIIETYQKKNKTYLYWLPLLMILWVNIHGGFVMGFVLLSIYIVGNIFRSRFVMAERDIARKRARQLILVLLLCLLGSLINPQGFKLLLSPLEVVANQAAVNSIQEWMSPDFHGFQIYEYLLLLMIFILGISNRRLSIIEVLLLIVFTHMSLYSARFIPLFAIIVSPIIGKQADCIVEHSKGKASIDGFISTSENMDAADSQTKWNLWSVAAMAVVAIMCFSGKINYQFDKTMTPVDAVQFLKNEHIPGNMFNSDVFGNYIIYAASPEYDVFYDSREIYGNEKRKDYLKVAHLEEGWENILKKYDISWIITKNHSTFINVLLNNNEWHLIYSDNVADIFVKKTLMNQGLINKYSNVKPVFDEPDAATN